ncbi:glycosyltransferase [Pedobacter sp. Hv1]|uniref:glycosyltransferase n=1 Tax=Pedobacter sp. Hv1 TaxID=1740090 RepID=UPI0006D8B49D|nr:glycosyltransferase [Pedobacter sp. Hv1]KQB99322.1 hypothetical protein AQF98_17260 [Pedobacter sp. Hv1]
MISIIIASVDPNFLVNVTANITQTIGVEFEVIGIANGDGKMGICEVYNKGFAQAKYDILCFMHEDLLMKSENWGEIVIDIFKTNPAFGLIGIAGGQYKSVAPSSWYCYENEAPELLNYNLVQRYKYTNKATNRIYANPTESKLIEVASIDGVWFCCTRAAINSYAFDQELLKGFHGYDLDFSLGLGQKYKVGVTFDILIEHFSEGYTDRNWLSEILKIHAKWNAILPINITNLPKAKAGLLEKRGFRGIIGRMKTEDFTFAETQAMLLKSRSSKMMTTGLFLKLYLHLLKVFLKKGR